MKADHLIFDLNGTMANTKRIFVATRYRFIERIAALTGSPIDVLLRECRELLKGNSLNPDIAMSLPSVQGWIRSATRFTRRSEKYAAVAEEVARFRLDVVTSHRLSAGVEGTLQALRADGKRLSIWSGSRGPYVIDMLLLLGLDGLVDFAFCPAQLPGVRTSLDGQNLIDTQLIQFDADALKPSSVLLNEIVSEVGISAADTALIGNNIVGDGQSTCGTNVRFVLLDAAELDEEEVRRADLINGTELSKRATQHRQLERARREVIPAARIQSVEQLLSIAI
jgi:phosphoglycolate phosphatase-like HAD superfamily hydrolase